MLTLGSLHILRLPVRAWCGCALARKPALPALPALPPPAYCSSTLRHVSSGGADPGWYEQAALSAPVRLAEDFLIQVQQTSGLPWWLSIAFSTLTIRTLVTLPLAAYQMRVLAKVAPNKLHLEGRVLPGDVYLLENPTHPYPRNPEGFIKKGCFNTNINGTKEKGGRGGGGTQMGLQMSRLVRHLQRADKSFSDAFFVITVTHLRNHGNPQVEALQTEIATLAERLRYQVSLRASERGWTDKQSRFQFRKNLRRLVSQLYVRDNCHPFKASLLVWVQLPLWIGLSLALRNLCAPHSLLHTSLATGGTLWFPDLTSPDSTWLLPLALGLTNLFIVELFSLQRSNVSSVHKAVTNAMRMLSLLMIPIAAGVPSAMALYWWYSSLVGFSHNLLLRAPALRQILKLPTRPSDTPYKDLMDAVVRKFRK